MPIAFDVVNQTFLEVYIIPFSHYAHIFTYYIKRILFYENFDLTEVAGEGGPDLAPQKFLSSQKFRHLMG